MNQKIKILYGLEAASGGSLKHMSYLVCNLDRKQVDITVVISTRRSPLESGSEIEKMKASGANIIELPMMRSIHPLVDLWTLFRIYRLLGKQSYEIVHAHSSKAGVLFRIAAWLRHIPTIVYTPHCFYFQSKQTRLARYFFLGIELALSLITDYIIVSDNEKRAISRYGLVSGRKIRCINNAIKFSDYSLAQDAGPIKAELRIGPDKFVIGAIGRLERQKDWDTYMRVARAVVKQRPDAIFLIVGSGSEQAKINRYIHDYGLAEHVMVTGYIARIERIYAVVDVFVSTSLWEGLPYVFLEAMHYKKPIVTTAHGNYDVVVNDKTGLVSPCRDVDGMAVGIIQLMDNKEQAMRLGSNGYHHLMKNFHFRVFIQKHLTLYRVDAAAPVKVAAPRSVVLEA